jgi:hypothetical protein
MKIRFKFYTLLLSATAFAFLANCSGNKKEGQAENHDKHAAHDSTQDASGSTSEQMSESNSRLMHYSKISLQVYLLHI